MRQQTAHPASTAAANAALVLTAATSLLLATPALASATLGGTWAWGGGDRLYSLRTRVTIT